MTLFFLAFFGLYVFTCGPHVVPYRDAGEMSSLLGTLGVAHPPGYPLYTLVGKWITWFPLGNMIYRTNIFSALCAAGALTIFYLTLRTWLNKRESFFAACFLGFSNPFWELANVTEMYTLGVLWFCLLMFVTFRLKNPFLWAFLMALGLGVRMDMLLLIPIFLLWFIKSGEKITAVSVGHVTFFFLAGASVFMYLMLRSHTDPMIDWGNPETFRAVLNSASRKSYSGTLDLLSLSYKAGENFPINMRLYGEHLVSTVGWGGIILSLLGCVSIWRRDRHLAIFIGVLFSVMGPLFLYLANMPPNPHSLAIVEASYLIPDVMIAFLIGWSFSIFRHSRVGGNPVLQHREKDWAPAFAGATYILVGVVLAFNAINGFERGSKRHNLYGRDYLENIWRSVPRNAIAVFHKDVQLFSLWASQLLEQRRPDVSLISTGLSASPWYWEMKGRWKTAASPQISVKEPNGWKRLVAESGRPVVVGFDVELRPMEGLDLHPQGAVLSFSKNENASHILSKLCVARGPYVYGETPDFFSTDLIGDLARAYHQQGFAALLQKKIEMADWFLRRSETLDPTFSRASSDRGYLRFVQGDYSAAYQHYRSTVQKTLRTLALSSKYKSLPEVVASCRFEASNAHSQMGAAAEKLGHVDEARQLYVSALNLQESAQTHYNLAVTYWGTDWAQVVRHMTRALELNPQMTEARTYLAKAQMMMGKR